MKTSKIKANLIALGVSLLFCLAIFFSVFAQGCATLTNEEKLDIIGDFVAEIEEGLNENLPEGCIKATLPNQDKPIFLPDVYGPFSDSLLNTENLHKYTYYLFSFNPMVSFEVLVEQETGKGLICCEVIFMTEIWWIYNEDAVPEIVDNQRAWNYMLELFPEGWNEEASNESI